MIGGEVCGIPHLTAATTCDDSSGVRRGGLGAGGSHMRKRSAKRVRMRGRQALARFALPPASLACAAIGLALPPAASAATEQFTTAGCTTWPVPAGVTSVQIEATGAAGEDIPGNGPAEGGRGDRVSASLSSLAGGQLFVCVDSGGGNGGNAGGTPAGDGGGASGVALGSDFSAPLLVAGGGGGVGSCIGSPGGDAGMPVAADGGDCGGGVDPGGGGNNSTMQGGTGGAPGGSPGAGFTAAGPGIGGDGSGGGGGGGYFGGGGGATETPGTFNFHAGGGGGTDFCAGTVSGCAVTSGAGTGAGAGTGSGDAKVLLTYAANANPTLTTMASADVALGGSVSDTATLANGFAPTGQITFRLFGPGQADCSGAPVFTDIETVSGNGSYESAAFTPTEPGTYRWVASYSGDFDNHAVAGSCNDPGDTVTVSALPPDGPTVDELLTADCRSSGAGVAATRPILGSATGGALLGTEAQDMILGGQAADEIRGLADADCVRARRGKDEVDGGTGRDVMNGGKGADTMDSSSPERDRVACGKGRDEATISPNDRTRGCEEIETV